MAYGNSITHKTPNQFDVELTCINGGKEYVIKYGAEVNRTINYHDACVYLGQALMHAAHCNGIDQKVMNQ